MIASVTIEPNTGIIYIGDSVLITVTAGDIESGLNPSEATFNSKQISLSDQGDGTYAGVYMVMSGDNSAVNAEATDITLTDIVGNVSLPGSSTGSRWRRSTAASMSIRPSLPTMTSPGPPRARSVARCWPGPRPARRRPHRRSLPDRRPRRADRRRAPARGARDRPPRGIMRCSNARERRPRRRTGGARHARP